MTADSQPRVRRRPSWVWRWLLTVAAAQCAAGLGALFPRYSIAAFDLFVWTAHGGSSPRWESGLQPHPVLGAFFGFVLGWMAALLLLAIYLVIKEPRPRL